MNVREATSFAFVCASAIVSFAAPTLAQTTFPDRTVRIIVPHPAGGSTDVVTRIVAEKMQSIWGKPVVIENIVGAAGMTATTQGANAAPDGYTMTAIVGTTTTLLASLKKRIPYDPIRDFDPLVLLAHSRTCSSSAPSSG
jgi:tripartite-type tricarboxylate transporter receptor subunit TctC